MLINNNTVVVFYQGPNFETQFTIFSIHNAIDGQSFKVFKKLRTVALLAFSTKPSVKIAQDQTSDSIVHVALNQGHPQDQAANSVFYIKIDFSNIQITRANHTPICLFSELPIKTTKNLDLVYDSSTGQSGNSWIWDVSADKVSLF